MTPFRCLPPLLGLLALAACSQGQSAAAPGAARARAVTAQQEAACRQRADAVFARQNPNEVYTADRYATSTRDAPFSTSGLPGITTRGLSGRYARDQMYQSCLTTLGSSPEAPEPADSTPGTPGPAAPAVAPAPRTLRMPPQ